MKDMVEGLNEMIEGINGIWDVAEKAINLAADRGQLLGDIHEIVKEVKEFSTYPGGEERVHELALKIEELSKLE